MQAELVAQRLKGECVDREYMVNAYLQQQVEETDNLNEMESIYHCEGMLETHDFFVTLEMLLCAEEKENDPVEENGHVGELETWSADGKAEATCQRREKISYLVAVYRTSLEEVGEGARGDQKEVVAMVLEEMEVEVCK